MKVKIWVLSTCVPDENEPCWPQVYASEEAAQKGFREAMESEWRSNGPEDEETGERLPFPDDPDEAHERIAELQDAEWGRWELTSHEIEIAGADLQKLAFEALDELGTTVVVALNADDIAERREANDELEAPHETILEAMGIVSERDYSDWSSEVNDAVNDQINKLLEG